MRSGSIKGAEQGGPNRDHTTWRDCWARDRGTVAAYPVILAAFVFLMILGPDPDTREDPVVLTAGQKIAESG